MHANVAIINHFLAIFGCQMPISVFHPVLSGPDKQKDLGVKM